MRNIKRELGYFQYSDIEDGEHEEKIDYDCLIGLFQEILQRLNKLEKLVGDNSYE